jgi:hypothetical protein
MIPAEPVGGNPMARRSVAILSSSGRKIGYTTYKQAKADLDAGRASPESERCIRLLPSFDGGELRPRQSGRYGPIVWQLDRLPAEQEPGS